MENKLLASSPDRFVRKKSLSDLADNASRKIRQDTEFTVTTPQRPRQPPADRPSGVQGGMRRVFHSTGERGEDVSGEGVS